MVGCLTASTPLLSNRETPWLERAQDRVPWHHYKVAWSEGEGEAAVHHSVSIDGRAIDVSRWLLVDAASPLVSPSGRSLYYNPLPDGERVASIAITRPTTEPSTAQPATITPDPAQPDEVFVRALAEGIEAACTLPDASSTQTLARHKQFLLRSKLNNLNIDQHVAFIDAFIGDGGFDDKTEPVKADITIAFEKPVGPYRQAAHDAAEAVRLVSRLLIRSICYGVRKALTGRDPFEGFRGRVDFLLRPIGDMGGELPGAFMTQCVRTRDVQHLGITSQTPFDWSGNRHDQPQTGPRPEPPPLGLQPGVG